MIIYNTTYTMPVSDVRNFVIWLRQSMLPRVEADQTLVDARLMRVLSHHDEQSECFSLQFAVADTATLHQWFVRQGQALAAELQKTFEGRIIGFSTLMEEI